MPRFNVFETTSPNYSEEYYSTHDKDGNLIVPEQPVAETPIPYVPPNPAGYNSIPEAGLRGQQVSDAGGVPMFTNVGQDMANPSVNPAEVVRLTNGAMSNGKVPPKPDEHAIAFANQIESFQKHIIDFMWGGNDLRTSSSASPQQQAQAQADMQAFTKMFADDLSGGKGALVKVLMPDGTIAYQPRNKAIGQQAATNYDPNKTFSKWEQPDKEMAFQTKMITGKDPKFGFGDRVSNNDYSREYNQYLRSKGLTAGDVALMQSDYKAGDMSLKNMAKQEAPMSAFVLNINKQIGKLEELYKNDDRVGLRLLDVPIRELKVRAQGSGLEATRASYLLEVSNEIGKLSSGASASVQQLSDSAKEDWKKVHDPNLSLKELMLVLKATRDQANMRMTTWREAKEEVRKNLKASGVQEPSPQQAQNAPPVNLLKEGTSTTFKNGQVWTLKNGIPTRVK